MSDFQPLEKILNSDFTQMRALQASGGMRATDEAIHEFINNLNEFYKQFGGLPTQSDLNTYINYMEQITAKINASEYAYYLDKYQKEYPETAEGMASSCMLQSFKDIPKRMQYWAASEEFCGTIRNAEKHGAAVKNFNKWLTFINKKRNLFFQNEDVIPIIEEVHSPLNMENLVKNK